MIDLDPHLLAINQPDWADDEDHTLIGIAVALWISLGIWCCGWALAWWLW